MCVVFIERKHIDIVGLVGSSVGTHKKKVELSSQQPTIHHWRNEDIYIQESPTLLSSNLAFGSLSKQQNGTSTAPLQA
jgi:hypothetical protein